MNLTLKQKKWIDKNKGKLSIEKIAKELNIPKDIIEDYLKSKSTSQPKKIFYLVLILIPIGFFILFEVGLRIFNYGYDYTEWVNVTKDKLTLNPELAHKYFQTTQKVPTSNQDIFDEIKSDSTYRVFVLGGSSGAGYPFLPNGSFSRYLKAKLQILYPKSKIEVINCSMTAINSYSLLDMMPGIIEQKPDLILIYAGHNEYYGALGVGSMESLGTSVKIVNLMVSLEKFRTFQLLKNTMRWAAGLFSKPEIRTGTLMARMAENQYITLNSQVYKKGIEQFNENLENILKLAKKSNIPVILGTLTCNLKDQHPFVSISSDGFPSADSVYNKAKKKLSENDLANAESLFVYAKDLDALRFRAPDEINKSIFSLANKFHDPVVNIDSAFNAISPDGIVGDNLMTDHLHPTLQGYKIIGNLYYSTMVKSKLCPSTPERNITQQASDSLLAEAFNFTTLDSIIANYRIKLLKNDWPYIDKNSQVPVNKLLIPNNYIDSLALNLVENKSDWDIVHSQAAEYYYKKNDINDFIKSMNDVIEQYPIVPGYYDYTSNKLLEIKDYKKAYPYLLSRYNLDPNDYSSKWLGIINLNNNNIELAKKYLYESYKFNSKDPQVLYNLAGAYVMSNDYKTALDWVNKAVSIKHDYREALALQYQLKNALMKK